MISVNKGAIRLIQEVLKKKEELNIDFKELHNKAKLIDMGIKVKGGYEAGKYLAEICMGGLGKVNLFLQSYGDLSLPSVSVYSDYPSIALLGSQFAGWRIATKDYFAMGSGPARALSLKPKELYEKIKYKDSSDEAVLVLEGDKEPTNDVLSLIAEECNIDASKLYVLIAPTSSVAGSVQISSRVLEAGLHKLSELNMDLSKVLCGLGKAPIAPLHPKFAQAMGRTNDVILYAGEVYFTVDYDDEEELKSILERAPSSASSFFGKPFYQIFKEANFDFYKIDPLLFAPAKYIVNNKRSGKTYNYGSIRIDILKNSLA
ncbi:MAG: methenyltetrahydromethanopterin cyclohydrolase [Nitrososphaerales archaeon]